MVLTEKELIEQDWWNENVVFVERNPADGEGSPFIVFFCNSIFFVLDTSYERLLSVFVGSYYVDVRTFSSKVPQNLITEDLLITRDALGKDFYFFLIRFLNFHSHQSSYLRKES